MDFARRQLEKYGWSDGKGLGRNEDGISQALKPKLKRSVAGIGHDPAADFTEHWWTKLYDKAAENVEVKEKHGKTKKIKTKDDQFKITNSSYHLNKKTDPNQEEYSDFFVKTVVMTGAGTTERVKEDDTDSESEKEKKDVFKMTDEELFAACEGRTAHKGARHGIRATGKLARIARQEQMLLAEDKYNGYSHKKHSKIDNHELATDSLHADVESDFNKRKKKKKCKHCFDNNVDMAECDKPLPDDEIQNGDSAGKEDDNVENFETNFNEVESLETKKTKRSKKKKKQTKNNIMAECDNLVPSNEIQHGVLEGNENNSDYKKSKKEFNEITENSLGNKKPKLKKNKIRNIDVNMAECQEPLPDNEIQNGGLAGKEDNSEIERTKRKSNEMEVNDSGTQKIKLKKKKNSKEVMDDDIIIPHIEKVKKNKKKKYSKDS